jgi:hypothetical protein
VGYLSFEIADTDNPEFRYGLKERRNPEDLDDRLPRGGRPLADAHEGRLSASNPAIHQMLSHRELEPEFQFGNGETILVRSTLPSYLDGRRVAEFNVDGEIQVVEVTRAGRSMLAGAATTIEAGDQVSFAVASTSLARLRSFLAKDFGS